LFLLGHGLIVAEFWGGNKKGRLGGGLSPFLKCYPSPDLQLIFDDKPLERFLEGDDLDKLVYRRNREQYRDDKERHDKDFALRVPVGAPHLVGEEERGKTYGEGENERDNKKYAPEKIREFKKRRCNAQGVEDELNRKDNIVQMIDGKIGKTDQIQRRQKRHPVGPGIKARDAP